MHLDGYKYWLAYTKGSKSYYRCSRSKSQKCPGKLIMENSKVITSIPHDHEKEAKNNAVEKFRKVLTKKAIEKPNKSLVDIYLEETLNHSEASILYPFSQAESTMRKARGKVLEEKRKVEEKMKKNATEVKDLGKIEENRTKNEENIQDTLTKIDENFTKMDNLETKMQDNEHKIENKSRCFEGSLQIFDEKLQNIEKKLDKIQEKRRKTEEKTQKINKISKNPTQVSKTHHHHKYFYVEVIDKDTKVILMNQGTLNTLGKIEEVHIDCGMKVDVRDVVKENTISAFKESDTKNAQNDSKSQNFTKNCPNLIQIDTNLNKLAQEANLSQNSYNIAQEVPDLPQLTFLDQNFTYTDPIPIQNYENLSLVYQDCNQTDHTQIIQTIEFSAFSSATSTLHSNFTSTKVDTKQLYGHRNDAENLMRIDFQSQKELDTRFNEKSDDFVSNGSDEISFEQSNKEVQNIEAFGQTHYFQDYHVSCSDNSHLIDNNLHQTSLTRDQNLKVIEIDSESQYSDKNLEKLLENQPGQDLAQNLRNQNFLSQVSMNLQEKDSKPSKIPSDSKSCQPNLKFQTNQYQILTFIVLIKGRDCPIAIGILNPKNQHSIQQLLSFLKQKLSLIPSTILTSQDPTLQLSINQTWPDSTVKIMYFYYAQFVIKNLHKNLTEITKNIFEISSLKMILSMPLIPTNYVIPGWEALRKWMNEKNVNLNSLCDDVYTKWLSENAERISIFNGLTHSINNHTKVFQSELINSFEAVPIESESLIDKISRQATKSYLKFTKSSEISANKIQKLQKTVKIATKNWISSPFHLRRPIQFLQQVSHCIDDGMINFVMNFDGNFCEVRKLEPPPLVFFENCTGNEERKRLERGADQVLLPSEPPPLVLIRR